MGGIAEVIGADRLQQIAAFGSHDAEHRLGSGDIGDHGKGLAQMAAQPGQVALQRGPRHHQQIGRLGQAGDGQVAFDPALGVQHLCVDNTPCGYVDVIGAHLLQEGAGIAAFNPDLAKGGHVEQAHAAAHCHMFGLLVVEPVLPAPGIAVLALLPGLGEPVGPFPTRNLAKHRAARFQMFVQRRAAHAARGFHLTVGEVIGVEQAQRFGYPFLEVGAVLLERLGAADVHFPQVKRGFAFGDPMRQRHARPARGNDADGIVPGGNPVAAKFRRLSQIVAVIGGEAFRPVEEGVNPGGLEQRHAVHRRFQDRLEMVEILGQGIKAEILADTAHAPGFRLRLEGAQHHLARVLLVIGAFIGHAQHRQMAQPLDRFGHQVEMLAGMQRQGDAVLIGQVAAPHAAAVDHDIGGNMAGLPVHHVIDAGHPPPRLGHAGDLDAFKDLRAAHPRALGQRHGDIGRVALSVQRQGDRADDVRDVQMRVFRLDLGGRNLVHLDIEDPRHGGLAQQFLMPRLGQRDRDRSDLAHAGRHACLGLQLHVKIGGILRQPRHVGRAAQLADQPRRMPGGAAGQLLAFQQHDVGPACLRQMIGHRTAGNAAPDDDGPCLCRNVHVSLYPLSVSRRAIAAIWAGVVSQQPPMIVAPWRTQCSAKSA